MSLSIEWGIVVCCMNGMEIKCFNAIESEEGP